MDGENVAHAEERPIGGGQAPGRDDGLSVGVVVHVCRALHVERLGASAVGQKVSGSLIRLLEG